MDYVKRFFNNKIVLTMLYIAGVTLLLHWSIIIYSVLHPEYRYDDVINISGLEFNRGVWNGIQVLLATILLGVVMSVIQNLLVIFSLEKNIKLTLNSFENKINVKLNHGLREVNHIDNYDIDMISKIKEMKSGTHIMWLNTYINGLEDLLSVFPDLVKYNRINIRILVMSPDNDNLHYRAESTRSDKVKFGYVRKIKDQEKLVYDAMKDWNNNSRKGGFFDIKFYKYTPHFPLLIIKENVKDGHEEAHTGFYLNKPASESPYLTWNSHLKGSYINELEEYFDHLWKHNDNHSPRSYIDIEDTDA